MRSRCILSKNCSIHGENNEISGPYNLWAPVKSNISDVWNWNYGTFLGSKIEVGGRGGICSPLPSHPLTTQWLRPCMRMSGDVSGAQLAGRRIFENWNNCSNNGNALIVFTHRLNFYLSCHLKYYFKST